MGGGWRLADHAQIVRVLVPPSAAPVSADKVRVAELARGRGAIRLAPGPEIAASEAAEHGGPAGLRALPLQGEEDLLHRKTAHAVLPIVHRQAAQIVQARSLG